MNLKDDPTLRIQLRGLASLITCSVHFDGVSRLSSGLIMWVSGSYLRCAASSPSCMWGMKLGIQPRMSKPQWVQPPHVLTFSGQRVLVVCRASPSPLRPWLLWASSSKRGLGSMLEVLPYVEIKQKN